MKEKHSTPTYALATMPRPADREIRMRPVNTAWLMRNQKEEAATHE